MEGKVEEEKGAMAEDEEEMAEAGEVEKRRMHQCSECGKRYKHEHKLKHHKKLFLCLTVCSVLCSAGTTGFQDALNIVIHF